MIKLSELLNESDAAEEARKKGLHHLGGGAYGKKTGVTTQSVTTHVSKNGKLVPVDDIDPPSRSTVATTTGMSFGRGKNANTTYGTKGANAGRPTSNFDPKTGRLSSLTKRTPDQQRVNRKGIKHDPLQLRQFNRQGIDNDKQTKFGHIARSLNYKVIDANPDWDSEYSSADFMKLTKLTPAEFKFLNMFNQKYAYAGDPFFDYDPDTDTVRTID